MADEDETTPSAEVENPSAVTEKTEAHHERLADEGVPIEDIVPRRGMKNSAAEIAERRAHVYTAVMAHGMPVACVAEDLEVSEKTVYEDLKVLRGRVIGKWQDARRNPERRLEALADLTMRLDLIYQNSMLAAANVEGGEEADARAQVQFLRIAMEASSRKGTLLDNAGALPRRADGHAVTAGGGFELNLKATFGLGDEEDIGRSVGPKEIRRILEWVRVLKGQGEAAQGLPGPGA